MKSWLTLKKHLWIQMWPGTKHASNMPTPLGLAHARPFSAPLRSTCHLQATVPPLWPRSAPCTVQRAKTDVFFYFRLGKCIMEPCGVEHHVFAIQNYAKLIRFQWCTWSISLHGLSIKPPPYPTQLPLRFWGNGLWLLDLVCQLSFITFLCRMWATCWLVWLMEHLERSHVPDMGEVANSVWLPGDEIQMGCNLFPDHVSTRWTKMCATGTPFQTSITNGQQQSTKHTENERRAIIGSDVRSARIQQWLGGCSIILLALNNTAQVWQAVFEDLPKDKSLRVTNTKPLTNLEVYMKGN